MKNRFFYLVAAGLLGGAFFSASPAMARKAHCLITSGPVTQFRGVCDFRGQADGSFSLTAAKSSPFLENTIMISVQMISKGRADVRGLTKSGINSRWGMVRRSRKNPACWLGSDFKICAW